MALPGPSRPGHKMDPKTYFLEYHRARKRAGEPHLQHLLRQILERDIDEWRRQSFDNFVIEIDVSKHIASKSYIDEDGDHIGWYTYNFQLVGSEARKLNFAKPMSIKHSRGEIWVRYRKRFRKIGVYLDALKESLSNQKPQSLDPDQQLTAWNQQAQWWRANGKSFSFMALPQELREGIYVFALEGAVEPFARARCRKNGWQCMSLAARQPKMSLCRTSRQVYQEASHVFWLHSTFLVEHYGVLRKVFQNEQMADRVRKLKLALEHCDVLRLFGVDHEDGELIQVETHGNKLRTMKLSLLEICIAPPTQVCRRTWLDDACHTQVVKLMLDAAWSFVKGHPVMLTGYAKSTQVEAFEIKNAAERSAVETWQRERALYGLDAGSLQDYDDDQWLHVTNLSEEFEGVRLDGKLHEKTSAPDVKEMCEEMLKLPGPCLCDPPCKPDERTG